MYTSAFNYYRPQSLAEALALLHAHPEAKVLAGGHSLIPAMKLRVAQPAALVDIGRLPGLAGITEAGGALRLGALTTHNAVASSALVRAQCGLLAEAASQIGDQQVRNRGTLGGSLAHADPAADYPTVILALGATLHVAGAAGERTIPAGAFFTGLLSTALGAGELLTAVTVPVCGAGTGGAYLKHPHPASGYAVAGAAALVTVADGKVAQVSLAIGGVCATPVRAAAAEKALAGQAPSESAIAAAAAKAAEALSDPLSDSYASGDYRVHLATVLAKRALTQAVARAQG